MTEQVCPGGEVRTLALACTCMAAAREQRAVCVIISVHDLAGAHCFISSSILPRLAPTIVSTFLPFRKAMNVGILDTACCFAKSCTFRSRIHTCACGGRRLQVNEQCSEAQLTLQSLHTGFEVALDTRQRRS